jgi:hypothetical protein
MGVVAGELILRSDDALEEFVEVMAGEGDQGGNTARNECLVEPIHTRICVNQP